MPSSPRVQARVAGIAYLVTHVTAVTAVLAYGAGAVPAGVTLELMLAFGCVATGVLVGWLLRAAGPTGCVSAVGGLLRCSGLAQVTSPRGTRRPR